MMNSLIAYLQSLDGQLQNCHSVVLGNEAADLDSMVASVAYGYLLHCLHPERPVVPLINIRRYDFHLRPEAVHLFGLAGIAADDLVFRDDINQELLFSDTDIILVDHNVLPRALMRYSKQVCAVLDHHRDEGLYQKAEPRIIQRAGSSCSLVAQEYIRYGVAVVQEIVNLLMGTILLDTINLDSVAGKTHTVDRMALQMLVPLSTHSPGSLFKRLRDERFNVGTFSGRDLLRRDYKEYYENGICWGIAVIPLDITEILCRKGGEYLPVHCFAKERSLDFLLLMFFSNTSNFRRQLMVYWPDAKRQGQLFEFLQNSCLDLYPIPDAEMEGISLEEIRCYQQGNSSLSRKAVHPLVADFLDRYP